MLLLKIKEGGAPVIVGAGENQVTVAVCSVDSEGAVTLGFEAPRHIPIDRKSVRKRREASVHEMMNK